MDNNKLAEALRVTREWLNSDKWRNSTIDKHRSWEAMMRGIDAALAEYEVHAAKAVQSAESHKGLLIGTTPSGIPYALHGTPESVNAVSDMLERAEVSLQIGVDQPQATEPVYQYQATPDSWVDCDYDLYNASGDPKRILYTHPQPAQDAKDAARYRHMIETSPFMCFGASEYRKKSDLDEAIDDSIAAMAKESGR